MSIGFRAILHVLVLSGFLFVCLIQWYLTQNNPYAKEAYFAIAYSGIPPSAL